jgi:hypothetical protein
MAGEQLICVYSITKVEGNADIEIGNGETPTEADSRGSKGVWDDEDEW